MTLADLLEIDVERKAVEWLGLVVLTLAVVHEREVVHAVRRLRRVVPEDLRVDRQRLRMQRLGGRELALLLEQRCKMLHALGRGAVVVAEQPATLLQCTAQETL